MCPHHNIQDLQNHLKPKGPRFYGYKMAYLIDCIVKCIIQTGPKYNITRVSEGTLVKNEMKIKRKKAPTNLGLFFLFGFNGISKA